LLQIVHCLICQFHHGLLIRMKNLVLPRCPYSPCGGDNQNYLCIDKHSLLHCVQIKVVEVLSYYHGEQEPATMRGFLH